MLEELLYLKNNNGALSSTKVKIKLETATVSKKSKLKKPFGTSYNLGPNLFRLKFHLNYRLDIISIKHLKNANIRQKKFDVNNLHDNVLI